MVALTLDELRYPEARGAALEVMGQSASPEVNTAITDQIRHLSEHVRFRTSLTSQTLIVRLQDAKAAGGRILIKSKVVLNQTHGIRFLNRYMRLNEHYRAHKFDVTDWMTSPDGPFQLPPGRLCQRRIWPCRF